jgi:hypothetical protein
MTGAPRLPRRRPRPGPEKAAFDAWHLGGPAVAMGVLVGAGTGPRDQADFLRTVIGLADAEIPGYLVIPASNPSGGSTPRFCLPI